MTCIVKALEEAVSDVLEKMFLIRSLGQPLEESVFPAAEMAADMVARLSFQGDSTGFLTLRVTRAAARSVAADFLGAEESDLSEESTREVICELANMICGSVLSRIESSAGFRLANPEIASAVLPDDGVAATAWTIETGHGPLTATIYMEATA